jgi:hypothetical protein
VYGQAYWKMNVRMRKLELETTYEYNVGYQPPQLLLMPSNNRSGYRESQNQTGEMGKDEQEK